MTHKKQHLISQTYLKHFSANGDGNNLFVIDRDNIYKKGIQKTNSGDSIFWEKNYSDSKAFADPKAIENLFGQGIEPSYNKIVSAISSEDDGAINAVKIKIIQWIFYTKLRSPIWEPYSQALAGETRYKHQLHLDNFLDESKFESALLSFTTDVMNKRWTIHKSNESESWWTSDNPGYCINIADTLDNKHVLPDPFCKFTGVDSVLFYPLSKKYCLSIHAYEQGTPRELNLSNTPLKFEDADLGLIRLINLLTLQTRVRLIIAAEENALIPIEILNL
jgi:Protein of unknown function (DUF4238)